MQMEPRPPREVLVLPAGIDHHVRDMTATFAADVTLETAQAHLAKESQWLPIDGDPHSPLGELVESNSTGPLRLGYGAWRDLLLGCQFENGRGELITAGGRTVKNVAGYDLTKFMVGQYGIFGRIITITTRTYRRPNAALLATFEPDVRRLNAMLATPARPQWSLLTPVSLLCGYLGDEQTIAFYEMTLPECGPQEVKRQRLDADMSLRADRWFRGACRASVPPVSIARFVSEAGLTDWAADPAFGIVVGRHESVDHDRVQKAARTVAGSVIFFDATGRPANLVPDPSTRAILERLKYAFDPDLKLAPLPQEPA